ncbi:hypothetical protein VNI00_008015 [Paramarasmius palmivorus]|uniref:Uncharacterized protein n=1 Tax=Paramarasmius palmivorus TaxID=297713 RepID=A0AAW0CXG3_9AGAR
MSAVLGDLNLALWTDVSSMDVNSVITDPENRERQNLKLSIRGLPHLPNIPDPVMEPQGIKLLFAHQCLMAEKIHNNFDDRLGGMGLETKDCHLAIPFSVMGRLWTHQDPNVREQGVALLQQCKKSWEKSSSNVPERVAFVTLLAKHINDTNRTSVLVEKEQAHGFVKFIHNEIITGTLYIWDIGPEWLKATRKVLQGGNLSSDYFAPLPKRRDPLRPHRLPPSSMPRFREPEANTMDIRTIDDAPVDGVGPSSSSATGRGHTASPEPHAFTLPADAQEHEDGLGSGTDSDDPRYLDSTQRGEDMGSPSHSISPERFCNKSPLVQDTHFSAGIGAAHFGVPENSVTASGSEGPCLDGTTGTPAPSLEPLGHLQVLGPVIVAANTTQDQVSHADPALIRAPERAHTREPPGHSGETFGQSSVQPPILRTNDTTANPRDVA